jgi:hypothetical protein
LGAFKTTGFEATGMLWMHVDVARSRCKLNVMLIICGVEVGKRGVECHRALPITVAWKLALN